MSQRQSKLVAASALTLLLTLNGCATTTDIAGTTNASTACQSFEPIRWSTQDTDQTISQVKEHNAVWDALCRDQTNED